MPKTNLKEIKEAIKKKETELEGLKDELEKCKREELEEKKRLAEKKFFKELLDNVDKESKIDKSITDFLKDEIKIVEQNIDKSQLIKLNKIIKEERERIKNLEGDNNKLAEKHEKIAEKLETSRKNKNVSESLARDLRILPNKIKVLKHQLFENKKIIESLNDKKNFPKKFVYIEEINDLIDEITKCKERKDEIINDKNWINLKKILKICNEKEVEFSESLKIIKDAKTRVEEMKKIKLAVILKTVP